MPFCNYTANKTVSSDCLHGEASRWSAYVDEKLDSGQCKGAKGRKLRILYLASDPRSRVFDCIKENKMPQLAMRVLESSIQGWIQMVTKYNEGRTETDRVSALAEITECLKTVTRGGVNLVLDVSEEDHCIQSACEIENNPNSPLMEYNKFFNVRENELQRRIEKYKPDIVQISGHGSADSLCFCDGTLGRSHTRRRIDDIVRDVGRLESQPTVMVITCCYSTALAKALLDKTKVRMAIACEGGLISQNAIEFTQVFYHAIATGESVEEAYTAATRGKGMRGTQGLKLYKGRNKEEIRFFADSGWNDMDYDRMARLSKANLKQETTVRPIAPITKSGDDYCKG